MSARFTRLQNIIEYLRAHPEAPLDRIATAFGVSVMTVRRDLAMLEENGIVEMTDRGAVARAGAGLFQTEDTRYSLVSAETRFREEKSRVAARAVEMIQPDDTIVIDTGSTTEFLARAIPDDLRCTILCYTVNALVEVNQKPACTVLFAGGLYHPNAMMFESPEGRALIERSRANTAFLSAAGISDTLGVTCANQYELETKRAVMASAVRRVLVSDSSKFDRVRSTLFAELADFTTIITDDRIPARYRDVIEGAGIELIVVSSG
jgi:DeoR family deoxyribose operon repressor